MYAQPAHTPNPSTTRPASAPIASSGAPPLPARRAELLDDLQALVDFLTDHPHVPVTAVRCWYSADLDIGTDNHHVGRLVVEHIADELDAEAVTTQLGDHATHRDFGDTVTYQAYYVRRAVDA